MKRTPMKPGTVALKRTAFARPQRIAEREVIKVGLRIKSRQRAVTTDEKRLWDRLASLGCPACAQDGHISRHVSIHHIDGRTKPDCHKRVLPLCAGHHQDGTGEDKTLIAVHPYKSRFEARYGNQYDLLAACMRQIQNSEAATGLQPDAASHQQYPRGQYG